GDVVLDDDGEVVFRSRLGQVVINGFDHGRSEFLGREAVASTDNFGNSFEFSVAELGAFMNGADDIEIERLAGSSGFLGAIEDGDLFDASGKSFHEMFDGERAVEADFQEANLFAGLVEKVGSLVRGLGAGAHHDNHALGIGRTDVIEEVIGTAYDLGEFVHNDLDFFRTNVVEGIAGFARLKVDIGILRCAAQYRMVGRERALAMLGDTIKIDQSVHVLFVQHFDLVDLVRCSEAVKKMEEGNTSFKRGGVRDESEIHGFLNGIGREHGISGGAAEHHVRVVAEDG